MKEVFLTLVVGLAAFAASCGDGTRRQTQANPPSSKNSGSLDPGLSRVDGKQYFRLESLNEDLRKLADEDYGKSKPDYSDPDNSIGTPPFQFVKVIHCDVFKADDAIEHLIKRTNETATVHRIVILRDARQDLYSFTATSTDPDKRIVRLEHYGPLTNENPNVVNLPISRRRMTDFPIDFNTGKAVREDNGKCIFIPYPFPADQEYWLFGNDLNSSPLQGLYRNDRYKNVHEIIGLIEKAVKSQEEATTRGPIRR